MQYRHLHTRLSGDKQGILPLSGLLRALVAIPFWNTIGSCL
jgi:hypothetical protein